MFGSIDNYGVSSTKIKIGGWSYSNDENKNRIPADCVYVVFNGGRIESKFHSRKDLSEYDNKFGFIFENLPREAVLLLMSGLIDCYAVFNGAEKKIEIWDKIRHELLLEVIVGFTKKINNSLKKDILTRIISGIDRGFNESISNRGLADVLVQEGFESFDQSASIGKEGFLFLEGGSNSVKKLYLSDNIDPLVNKWVDLIRNRSKEANLLGAKFLQIIIPEKQSILSKHYHVNYNGATPLLKRVSAEFLDFPYYFDAHKALEDQYLNTNLLPYRKVDTHLSFEGAKFLFRAMCDVFLNFKLEIPEPELVEISIKGDLAHRFGFGDFYEKTYIPDDSWELNSIDVELVRKIDPGEGKHVGVLREWRSKKPIIPGKVLIFGNSMFERGQSPFGLSWWCKIFFEKTVFIWSPVVDFEVVKCEKPDYVIAQTVERFMKSVPNS